MENNSLENILNENTDGKFGFRFKSAKLEKTTGICCVEMFYNDGVILSQKDRIFAEQLLLKNLPSNFNYDIKFIKNFVVNEAVKDSLKSFMHKNHPSILCEIAKVDCENKDKKVLILVDEKIIEHINNKNIKQEIEHFLKENFYADIEISIDIKKQQAIEEVEDDLVFDAFDIVPTERYIEVSNVEAIIGDLTETNAYYIKDKTSPEDNVVFCGKMLYLKDFSYTPKKKQKEDEQNKQPAEKEEGVEEQPKEKKLYKFVLEDFTGKISCVVFETKNNKEQLEKLESGVQYIISGKLEADKFSGGVSMRVKNISKCTLPERFEEEINYKPEPARYRWVFPEEYQAYAQDDLFSLGAKKEINEFFLKHDVVVFDFETTGLELDGSDKIIEIGAVKIQKGVITEKFMSYVDPMQHIPEESTAIHGIVDDDVKGAPTYDMVLADFYKFTRNCYLSGYNIIGFDCIFLTNFGRKCGYNFDNPVIDVYKIAQQEVKGTKNLKLKTVAEALGVTLDNAHRAVYDTIATAEVLLKIAETAVIPE